MLHKLFLLSLLFILRLSPIYAQNDFNFTFYPADQYTKQIKVQSLDTLTQKVSWKTDSTGSAMRVSIEKNLDDLRIVNLSNPSNLIYSEKVKYLGIDANQCLIYEALTEKKEILTISPVLGFAMITFRNCDGNKFAKTRDECDTIMHCFGKVLTQYKIK